MKLFLLRHGKTSWNLEKRLQGRRDTELDPSGIAEILEWIIPGDVGKWFVSPLHRACQTAEYLGLSNYTVSNDLIEMDWGEWEGYSIGELRQQDAGLLERQESKGLDMLPPSGETPRQVQERFRQFLGAVDLHVSTGVIAHKGIIQVALDLALGGNHFSDPVVRVRNGFCYQFHWNGESLKFDSEVSLF